MRIPATDYASREAYHFPDSVTRAIDEERRVGTAGGEQLLKNVACDGAARSRNVLITYDD